jgi:hypothetical protein
VSSGIALVGDGIENPANARIMKNAAAMFGARALFRDTKGLEGEFDRITSGAALTTYPRIVACDNLPNAKSIYGFNAGREFALAVGNERRGLSHEFSELATDVVEIPMHSRRVNCLNVAAASAVALYYLCGSRVGSMAVCNDPSRRRPEILFQSPCDHFEFGSAVRSAAAFGWNRAFIEDSHAVWFNSDRTVRAEARAAARRGKNDILLIPQNNSRYDRISVVSIQNDGAPLQRLNLAGGSRQLVVFPDESGSLETDWKRFGRSVEFARVELPEHSFNYHYRLIATIGLAEIARQVGVRAFKAPPAPRRPAYEFALEAGEPSGELISFEELLAY